MHTNDEDSAEIGALRHERDNALGGYRAAAGHADRFRDVLAEALGYEDENPGDDALIRDLRARFDKTGPEPTRWRDFCTGALAQADQINAPSYGTLPAQVDYIWGATKPASDGFINPASVSRAATEEGARHRCEVLGDGHIVVRAESLNWVALPPGKEV